VIWAIFFVVNQGRRAQRPQEVGREDGGERKKGLLYRLVVSHIHTLTNFSFQVSYIFLCLAGSMGQLHNVPL
jgi:hypothetical protein